MPQKKTAAKSSKKASKTKVQQINWETVLDELNQLEYRIETDPALVEEILFNMLDCGPDELVVLKRNGEITKIKETEYSIDHVRSVEYIGVFGGITPDAIKEVIDTAEEGAEQTAMNVFLDDITEAIKEELYSVFPYAKEIATIMYQRTKTAASQ